MRETADENQPGHWFERDPLWFKRALFYEIHIRGFFDGDGDGTGDFRGLIEKLDYLQWLGVDVVWLLPMYPSPLRDGGYDIADFTAIHPDFGTTEDFRQFVEEAHQRGIRVIADLVMNHTSSDHPWFQRARAAPPGSPERDWYVWSDDVHRYDEARIIFVDTETSNWTWDEQAGPFYWHRFFSHQPDLNFDNPDVGDAMIEVLRFWLDLGIDGFRLDAIPYLYERDGTNCENLPETHEFLKRVRREVDENYPDRVLLAEANQWPEDVVQYYGDGDECHMCFHFPIMPRMFMSLRREDATPMIEILEHTPEIPDNSQWGLFLRNHDELTLEMVTDEERDYMYAEYAKDPRMKLNLGIRRRLAPLLDNGRDEIELMHAILFSLPGSPVLYYGDEIGMGDNVYLGDRDGVRTPMQWTGDRNGGFSRADFAALYAPPLMDPVYGYQAVNVEAQLRTPTSLLRWMHRFIALRKEHPVFGLGTLEALRPENSRIFAHIRRYEDDIVLCVHNMARSAQAVELDLRRFDGFTPIEMLGRTPFPKDRRAAVPADAGAARLLLVPARPRAQEEAALVTELVDQLADQRWFGSKARELSHADVVEEVALDGDLRVSLVEATFAAGHARDLPAAARRLGRRRPRRARDRAARAHRRGCRRRRGRLDRALPLRRGDRSDAGGAADGRRAVQLVDRLRQRARAEGLPPRRAGDQPRARDRALPLRQRLRERAAAARLVRSRGARDRRHARDPPALRRRRPRRLGAGARGGQRPRPSASSGGSSASAR